MCKTHPNATRVNISTLSDDGYAPVGSVVFNMYWREHYTVLRHNEDGSVTTRWHGDGPLGPDPRITVHYTSCDERDYVCGTENLRLTSPLGARRERAVSCMHCKRETWNYLAECDTCMNKHEGVQLRKTVSV